MQPTSSICKPRASSQARIAATLDAARGLLADEGIGGLTIYSMAERAEMPPSSVYHFFPSVPALLQGLTGEVHAALRACLEQPVGHAGPRCWCDLSWVVEERMLAVYARDAAARQLILTSHGLAEVTQADRQHDVQLGQAMRALFERYFLLPPLPTDIEISNLAMEPGDHIYTLSAQRHGIIDARLAEEGMQVFDAYSRLYLPSILEKHSEPLTGFISDLNRQKIHNTPLNRSTVRFLSDINPLIIRSGATLRSRPPDPQLITAKPDSHPSQYTRCLTTRNVTVAATQMACSWDRLANITRTEKLVRQAAVRGTQIIPIQELSETPYFCQKPNPDYLQLATTVEENVAIAYFQAPARELQVVLPTSFFERTGHARFNSIAVIDADDGSLGVYRKSHIPDGPDYHEKYYFNPGDTGFKVWQTRCARTGVGICWNQWFPESARSTALLGAELLLYPTAIGSGPHDTSISSRDHWQRVQQGHTGANLMPLVASNRIGHEEQDGYDITFYGSSFITDPFGEKVEELNRIEEGILVHTFDLDTLGCARSAWGVFRDRRPNLYGPLKTLDNSLEF